MRSPVNVKSGQISSIRLEIESKNVVVTIVWHAVYLKKSILNLFSLDQNIQIKKHLKVNETFKVEKTRLIKKESVGR